MSYEEDLMKMQREAVVKYQQSRLIALAEFNRRIPQLRSIVENGIKDDSDLKVVKSACSHVLAELHWDKAKMIDKRGLLDWELDGIE